jgi:phosphotransacetylase
MGEPILLGRKKAIRAKIAELGLDLEPKVINPRNCPEFETCSQALFDLRQRRRFTLSRARSKMRQRN